jgi:hypothetical protein
VVSTNLPDEPLVLETTRRYCLFVSIRKSRVPCFPPQSGALTATGDGVLPFKSTAMLFSKRVIEESNAS